jgi:hypothetical protein
MNDRDSELGPDHRDDGIAAALAVPPLDDVTRRRLVSTALRGAARPQRRPWRAVAAAAALALVALAVIVVIVVRSSNDTSRPQAARTPATSRAPSPITGRAVPDFGDLSTAAARQRVRALARPDTASPNADSASGAPASSGASTGLAAAERCLPGVGPLEFLGTGRWQQHPVVVVVAGGRVLAVEGTGCVTHPL